MASLCCTPYDEVADYRLFEHRGRTYQFRTRCEPCRCGTGYVQIAGTGVWTRASGYWTLMALTRNDDEAELFCRGCLRSKAPRPHDWRRHGDVGAMEVEPEEAGKPALRSEWR